ncbi:MAG: alpha/beta hydrolase [Pseudomonadota bacterium]
MAVLEFSNTRLHYSERGEGTPVIALHSSASTGAQWNNLADHLHGVHRLIMPDLPGYGKTCAWPGQGPANVENEARLIANIIKSCNEPVHLVGHSWGGAVALKLAMALPEWTKSLTLIEPAVFHLLRDADSDADRRLHDTIVAMAGSVAAAAACGADEEGMAQFIDFWNGDGAWARTSPRVRTMLRSQIGQVINNFAAGFNETWALEEAGRIACPVMALMGMQSVPLAQRVVEMLAETIPDTRLHMIPDAGHMLPLSDPHIVDPLISGHLKMADLRSQKVLRPVVAPRAFKLAA